MSIVLRCDVCGIHAGSWLPQGWHKVVPVATVAFPSFPHEEALCPDCWKFLLDSRSQEAK